MPVQGCPIPLPLLYAVCYRTPNPTTDDYVLTERTARQTLFCYVQKIRNVLSSIYRFLLYKYKSICGGLLVEKKTDPEGACSDTLLVEPPSKRHRV